MATRTDRTTKLALRVEVATDTYKNRQINHINPSITDDKALYFGNKLGALQSHTLDKIVRTDVATLTAE